MLIYLLPPILIAIFLAGCAFISTIVGLFVMHSRNRHHAPFFFCVPTFATAGSMVLAWPITIILDQLNPNASYAQFLIAFPIGALMGGAIGWLVAWLIRRGMKAKRI